ncbi:MAG: hypothetical protein DRP46_14250, partial [Candidatus Zixiibacteriota bacterium]
MLNDEMVLDYYYCLGLDWDPETEVMWASHAMDQRICGYAYNGEEITETVADFRVAAIIVGCAHYDGILYACKWDGQGHIFRYDEEGEDLGDLNTGYPYIMDVAVDDEQEYLYAIAYAPGDMDRCFDIIIYDIANDYEDIATIPNADYVDLPNDQYRLRITWAPEHEEGHFWISGNEFMAQQFDIRQEDDEWVCELIQEFSMEDVTDVSSFGIAHDGENLWVSTANAEQQNDNTVFIVDDGIVETGWFTADPEEGQIAGGEDATINITAAAGEFEAGEYELIARIQLDDDAETRIDIAAVMIIDDPVAQLTGTVTDPATDEPVEDATVSMDYYLMERITDDEGGYGFADLPLREYEFTVTKPDYIPAVESIDLDEEGEFELNFDLLHSEFTPSQDEFEISLEPDLEYTIDFDVANGGTGTLVYSSQRRLLGNANADPWDIRIDTNAEEAAQDNQLNGLVVVDGMFYVSGGNNGDDANKIYVFNGDGQLQREFDQFHESRYGMRDLTWDGSLIWGADGTTLYGFNTDGELVETVEGQARSYRSLTWDPDHELFWSADVTTDIFSTDPEGNEGDRIEVPDEIRIYGLSYWADDPDGYCLYVFSRGEREGVDIQVNKVNVEDGDMVLVRELGVDGRPGGINITNQYDVYSQVLAGIVQSPDRIVVWQLEARRDWFQIDPEAGQIAAGESAGFQLTLDATGLPVDNTFEGEVVFTHDGVGGETILSATLDVVEGEVHTFRDLDLGIGWNLVSANLQPDDEDVEVIMSDLVDAGLLIMMKDGAGHFYRPDHEFNNIPGWYVDQGYQVKMRDAARLRLWGMSVLRDEPIDLEQGWQIVSYYPRFPVEATLALSGIEDHLLIAKDGFGNFYVPSWDFSNMGEMCEG